MTLNVITNQGCYWNKRFDYNRMRRSTLNRKLEFSSFLLTIALLVAIDSPNKENVRSSNQSLLWSTWKLVRAWFLMLAWWFLQVNLRCIHFKVYNSSWKWWNIHRWDHGSCDFIIIALQLDELNEWSQNHYVFKAKSRNR